MIGESDETVAKAGDDWIDVVERALDGDRREYARLARLVTGHLAHWRAYDFRRDWDDIVQDVLISVLGAYRAGQLDSPGAVQAYLRRAVRFKFIDRIRSSNRWKAGGDPESLEAAGHWPPLTPLESDSLDLRLSLASAIDALPEGERLAVLEIHVRGHTFIEAAGNTGMSRASLERALKLGLTKLRVALQGER